MKKADLITSAVWLLVCGAFLLYGLAVALLG